MLTRPSAIPSSAANRRCDWALSRSTASRSPRTIRLFWLFRPGKMARMGLPFGQVRVANELRKRAHGLPRRRSLCVAAPRLGNHEETAQGVGGQERSGGPGATEAQVIALEKAKTEKEAHGEFESEHPGYCGAQDTFYVGNLKGVGRIYQQTFIDTYTKVSFAKLYDRKTPITAADLLNDRVLPFRGARC